MKILKRILLVATIIIIGASSSLYYHFKSFADPSNQLDIQIQRQYENKLQTSAKRALDFSPFEASMEAMDYDRYSLLESLIVESDLDFLQKAIKEELFTIEELTTFYIKRIEALDHNKLNTVIELNPDAIKIARQLDSERDSIENRSSLYGMPVLLKDNIGTGDEMHTTAGAAALANSKSGRDAFIVQKLRDSGAIILGKANLSEWANFMSYSSSNGYSALGGQTLNPYGRFDVGGSSSGSAASVSASFSALTIGTETAGSIIYPSSQNSVVGFKPSLGLWSRDRIIPIAHAQDTAGPIGRTVADVAYLLEALAGSDEKDQVTVKAFENYQLATNFTDSLDPNGLEGLKVGIIANESATGHYRLEDEEILNRVIAELEASGAIVKEVQFPETINDINYMDVLVYEFKEGVEAYLDAVGDNSPINDLNAIIEFNKEDVHNRAPYGQELLELSNSTELTTDVIAPLILKNRAMASTAIDAVLKSQDVDVLLSLSNYISNVYAPAGYPAITVPAGYRESGEPIGMTMTSGLFQDTVLIKAAYGYEQSTKHRIHPKLK